MAVKTETPGSPLLRQRKAQENGSSTSETNSDSVPKYTKEQAVAVEQIRKCKDYYETLGVEKEAGESDLRKQYKKLALQFHPDKNKAPGSVEAFKAIGNAFSVLNDPVKRKRYDEFGIEAMQTTESHPAHETYYYSTFDGDFAAEELYRMFFHGETYVRRGNHFHRYNGRTANTHTHTYQEQESRSTLMQILPLIFIVSVSLLSSFFVSDPAYSLQRTTKYYYERRTSSLDVPYYVKENFLNNYADSIQRIERQVEDEYVLTIRSACFRERNYKENMIWRAKHFQDATLEQKARDLRTPSCDTLGELYNSYNKY